MGHRTVRTNKGYQPCDPIPLKMHIHILLHTHKLEINYHGISKSFESHPGPLSETRINISNL